MTSSRPRLLLLSTSFSHDSTGQEAAGGFVRDLVLALSRQAAVTVVAPAAASRTIQLPGYAVRYFAVARQPLSLLRPLDPRDWPGIVQALRGGLAATRAALEDGPVDLVVALWVLPSGFWARTATAGGTPYVTWALGSDIWSLGRVPGVRQVLARVLRGARKNYADGMELADQVRRIGGGDVAFLPSSRHLPVVARPAPLRREPPYRLAFLGRWHPNKGPDLLLDALALLGEQDWARIAEIRFAGGGPLEAVVRAKVEALQTAGRPVRLEGYMDPAQAAALIGGADYLLLPSRVESIPVIFSDALQAGTPLVATPVGDLPLLLQEQAFGVLAREVTAESFARALVQALDASPETFAAALGVLRSRFDLGAVVAELLAQARPGQTASS
jgi:glycosyltransferase involved in cell wall biosynthesis